MQPVPRLANNDNSCIIHGHGVFVKYGSRSGHKGYSLNLRTAYRGSDFRGTHERSEASGKAYIYPTTFTITQQQVTQTFQGSTPLQAPDLLNPVPTWPILLMGLFLLCSAFYLVRKLFHRLTPASRHKG